ncbi:hypothetical protein NLJ89_g11272 [Agrocybe chaxingu]|uniref:Zn(2)-C6 fungal-type domain-containing protein n=1 Tax=Agrocybe chaxingu TaxID=84603 RepID=A0A9W8JX33_9AGAR|nr:hypothetical protein NLJ89_g11272 [Agrocybe chaxingu]
MEDSFQFIIESPQHSQGHKKRPRLVTSCDNCRLKKIKCLQPSPEAKCEACKAAKIQCRFRDRERYFAERSRAIAGPNSGVYATELRSEPNPALDAFSVASGSSSPSMSSHSDPRSNSHSPKASGMRPNPTYMAHFIQTFFERYAQDFAFLSYQDCLADFWDNRLSATLANCIAAMAVKHSNHPDLNMPLRDLHNVAENYIDVAKALIASVTHIPSLETLQAIMLLCFRTYYGMASKMSSDLGLQDATYDPPTEYERSRRRATWAGMLQLHMTANSFRS